jgi:hypothetical protein
VDNNALIALKKEQIAAYAKTLTEKDTDYLMQTLSEKDDKLRYNAFLILREYSKNSQGVYFYWSLLAKKLDSDNSYQRSSGVLLLAENVRWDKEGKFAQIIDKFLACCTDEKFITARQTIQGLNQIIKATGKYNTSIAKRLANLDFSKYKENQQSLLKRDIAAIQKLLNK